MSDPSSQGAKISKYESFREESNPRYIFSIIYFEFVFV